MLAARVRALPAPIAGVIVVSILAASVAAVLGLVPTDRLVSGLERGLSDPIGLIIVVASLWSGPVSFPDYRSPTRWPPSMSPSAGITYSRSASANPCVSFQP